MNWRKKKKRGIRKGSQGGQPPGDVRHQGEQVRKNCRPNEKNFTRVGNEKLNATLGRGKGKSGRAPRERTP